MNNKKSLFVGAIVGAVVCLAISVYYIIPGYDHVLVTHDSALRHPTHAFAFFALAVVCVIIALVNRPKGAASSSKTENQEGRV